MTADLRRFREAQDSAATYDAALAELRRGRKTSHWMWFVFPQLAGLGRSPTARFYAIASPDEARAYAADPVLGPRLRECARALLAHSDRSAREILGEIDAMKLRSSMTIFMRAVPEETVFADVLQTFFDGKTDPLTEELLGG